MDNPPDLSRSVPDPGTDAVRDGTSGSPKGHAPSRGDNGAMSIMLAKGDAHAATALALMLRPMGHDVIVAADSAAAWYHLHHHHVDLVFSDWMMPGLDGKELCRRIRVMSGRPYIYIIGVTPHGGSDDRLDVLAAGADDFLTKPFDLRELVARLTIAHRHIILHEELEAKTKSLRSLATTDELTGLKNRRQFFDNLDYHFAQAALGQSKHSFTGFVPATRRWSPLSLILLDVDHFKAYNDDFGHPAGDDVLRVVADVLQRGTRDYDTVARHGGEEFAILLPDTNRYVALGMAERLRADFGRHAWPHRPVTASFGVATMTLGALAARDLVDQADRAMYASKRGGRNRITQSADLGGLHSAGTLLPLRAQGRAALVEALVAPTAGPGPGDAGGQGPTWDDIVDGWVRALVLRDSETVEHSRRVTDMVLVVSQALGIDAAALPHIRRGALLHDIGKMGIPDAILLKPGPLSEDEWAVMRRHPEYAYQFLAPVSFLGPALDIPFAHHEWWDGSGYPRGLRGEDIPLAARAFAAVDVWDALSHDRPYRNAWPTERVSAHIASLAGTHLDPRVVQALQQTIEVEACPV